MIEPQLMASPKNYIRVWNKSPEACYHGNSDVYSTQTGMYPFPAICVHYIMSHQKIIEVYNIISVQCCFLRNLSSVANLETKM